MDFTALIDRIIELDKNPEAYARCLAEPWFKENVVPQHSALRETWIKIFESQKPIVNQ